MSTHTAASTLVQGAVTAQTTSSIPTKFPARRVLGDLTPKAINAPQNINNVADRHDALRSHSPLKQVQTLSPVRYMDAENIARLSISGTARKRSINEVDGAVTREETREIAPRGFGRRENCLRPEPIAFLHGHTSFPVIDLMHDDDLSTTEADTPGRESNDSQETTASKVPFSSLINYSPHGSSQITHPPSSTPPPEIPTPSPESLVKSQAETLRLRLRIALYKVRTNQTNIPLANLALPTTKTPTPTTTPNPSSKNSSHTAPSPSIPSITISQPAIPRLLPAPVLLPTAYSSRHITEPYLPSSPPASISPDCNSRIMAAATAFATPVAQRRGVEQLSSPPESEERDGMDGEARAGRRREERFETGDLTSSVVKGRAASGLLELMRAG